MRKTAWKIIVLIMALLISGSSAFSTSLDGWANISNNTSKTELNGEKVLSSSSFFRNFNLKLHKPVTPMISYSFNLRAYLKDSEQTDHLTDITTLDYRRSLEPTLELFVRNSIYDLNVGYRRHEQWSTAHYSNEGRLTSEFYYSRFSVAPHNLPSISLDLERRKNFDHLPESETSDSTNSYIVGSAYTFPAAKMKFGYNIVFAGDSKRTPLSLLAKSVSSNFNNNYYIGYSDSLWNRKINYSVMYRGNYSRNRNRQYYTGTGSVPEILRDNNGGFSALDSDEQVSLASNIALTDANLITSAGIDLSADTDNHIGVEILFARSVDRLRIYVDEIFISDPPLENENNWEVYMSPFNTYGSWTPVGISDVNVEYDSLNDKYYYDILFSSSEMELYFKAVNLVTSSVADVDVTEIQARGTDDITDIGAVTDVSRSFTQGINLHAGIKPSQKWDFNFNYSIDRADQDPKSVSDSVSGIIENIFSKSLDNENADSRSIVTRNYGASARWQTYSLLTTTMNINRNEGFDNTGEADNASNNYSLTLNYFPLPTVDTNLTIIRSDRFADSEKLSTNHAVLLSADKQLYRDVNMVTDIGFSRSKDLADDTTTSVSSINGTLDARITRKMTGTLKYGYSVTTTESDTSTSNDFSTSLNYQAGRFINFSGNFDYTNSAGKKDISESIGVDWLPLPKIRLSADYQHGDSDGETYTTTTDSLSAYGTIYITRFANIRFSYAYTLTDRGGTSEEANHIINTNLNCRF